MDNVTYLDPNRGELIKAVDKFRARVAKGEISEFVILGVYDDEENPGYFSMLNVGPAANDVNMILDITKLSIVQNIMFMSDMYASYEEFGDGEEAEENPEEED